MRTRSPEDARAFLAQHDFVWHQHFELASGVGSPGQSPIGWIFDTCQPPADLTGATVLDIGTTNGYSAFEAVRRGASRVVAVDILDPDHFGFAALRDFFDAPVEFVQASVYELPEVLNEQFDHVFFLGVLYHLRHPLLGLDAVRRLARGRVYVESAIADGEHPDWQHEDAARFYRRDELSNDATNWFAPSSACLASWCASAGIEPDLTVAFPDPSWHRGIVVGDVTSGQPEYLQISYERPLEVRTDIRPSLAQRIRRAGVTGLAEARRLVGRAARAGLDRIGS